MGNTLTGNKSSGDVKVAEYPKHAHVQRIREIEVVRKTTRRSVPTPHSPSPAQNLFLEDRLHERVQDYDTADVLIIESDVFTATLIKKYLASTRIIKESDPDDEGRLLKVDHVNCTSKATALIGKGKTYGLILLHLSQDYTPTPHHTAKIMREMGYKGAIVFVATGKEFSHHRAIMREAIGSNVDGLIILGLSMMKTELERYISILTKRNIDFHP